MSDAQIAVAASPVPVLHGDPLQVPIPPIVRLVRRTAMISVIAFLLVIVPAMSWLGLMADQDVNKLGRFCCLAIAALGIDLIWGRTGILTLCHALFFCLGAYVMGMHLALPEGGGPTRPEYNGIPAFFFFNNVRELPAFWLPARSFWLTLILVVLVPAVTAGLLGYMIFRSRVRGVYFSIITQALAWAAFIAFSNNQLLLGGTNGLTDFNLAYISDTAWVRGLFLSSAVALLLTWFGCRWLVATRFGRILTAIRDNESRLRFAGYDPVRFKVAVFALGAALAGIAGALFVPQMGIITPNRMRVAEHILMVIWVAVGGRGRLWGAIFGALIVNYAYSALTSDAAKIWPFVQGGLFLAVVLLFPDGFAGVWSRVEKRLADGAGWLAAAITATPVLVVGAWALLECVSAVPGFLQWAPGKDFFGDGAALPLKYWLVIAVVTAAGAYERLRLPKAEVEPA